MSPEPALGYPLSMSSPPSLLDLESALAHRVALTLKLLEELRHLRSFHPYLDEGDAEARLTDLQLRATWIAASNDLLIAQVLRHQKPERPPGFLRRLWYRIW